MKNNLKKISAAVLVCVLFFPLVGQAFVGPYTLQVEGFKNNPTEPENPGSIFLKGAVYDSEGYLVDLVEDSGAAVNSSSYNSPAGYWKEVLPIAVMNWESMYPSMPISHVSSPFIMPTGTTTEYIRGDGTFATFPTIPTGTVTSVSATSSDFDISGGPITTSGTITANLKTSGVSADTYNNVTVTNKGIVTAGTKRSQASSTRSLNSAFQVSTTRDSFVNYSVDISTSVSLSGGAVGTVFLEIADNSGFTTNVQEIGRMVNGNTGTLVIGLTLNQTATAGLNGYVPAGKYVRLRTANTTGTPTFTYRSGQEVLM